MFRFEVGTNVIGRNLQFSKIRTEQHEVNVQNRRVIANSTDTKTGYFCDLQQSND